MLKNKVFSVKITEKEEKMKKTLFEDHDISISSIVRRCIRDKYYEFYPKEKKNDNL